jgi:hypothetical protein
VNRERAVGIREGSCGDGVCHQQHASLCCPPCTPCAACRTSLHQQQLTPPSPQELEKFKFVLDYKIKELKKQIEPRENEISEMKEQIKEVRAAAVAPVAPLSQWCRCPAPEAVAAAGCLAAAPATASPHDITL